MTKVQTLLGQVPARDREQYRELVAEARFLGRDEEGLTHLFLFGSVDTARRSLDPDRALFVLRSQTTWLERGQAMAVPGSLARSAHLLSTRDRVLSLLPPKTQDALRAAMLEMANAYTAALNRMVDKDA